MLQKLNERIQGFVTWFIVALVTLTLSLFGLNYYLESRHTAADSVAEVNNQAISKQAFELNYRRISQIQDHNDVNPAAQRMLKQQVLSEMIVNTVSMQAAALQGFDVDNHQTTQAILLIPQFQEDGHFSTSRYTRALTNAFFTPQSFQQEVRQGMLLNQQRFALMGTAFALPQELAEFVRLSLQTRDYQYTLIHADDFLSKIHLSDAAIAAYYQQHKHAFYTQEQVSIDYVRLSLADIKKTMRIAPMALVRYYEDNKANYLIPARWQLAYIRIPLPAAAPTGTPSDAKKRIDTLYDNLLAAPQTFGAVGQQLMDEHTAQYGRLPVVTAGDAAWDEALLSLNTPGQISPPIRTTEGYQILQLIAYEPAKTQPFLQVKSLIAEQLRQEAAQKKYNDAVEQLSELSYQNPDSLEFVATTLALPIQHSDLFTRQGGQDPLTQNKVVLQAAFGQDVLVFGNNSEPLALDTDDVVVLRCRQHVKAALQPLTAVTQQITAALSKKAASVAAQNFGKQMMHQGLASMKLPWHNIKAAGRDLDTVDSRINDLAFGMGQVDSNAGVSLENGDFALVQLLHIEEGNLAALDKEAVGNIVQQLESSYGLIDYDLYINQLMHEAKIVK